MEVMMVGGGRGIGEHISDEGGAYGGLGEAVSVGLCIGASRGGRGNAEVEGWRERRRKGEEREGGREGGRGEKGRRKEGGA